MIYAGVPVFMLPLAMLIAVMSAGVFFIPVADMTSLSLSITASLDDKVGIEDEGGGAGAGGGGDGSSKLRRCGWEERVEGPRCMGGS